jgi:hypothetical protein
VARCLVPVEALPKGSLSMVLGRLYDATKTTRPLGPTVTWGVDAHCIASCKATAKKIPEKWLFDLAHTYSLIYEAGTNLVIFDHIASTTTTVPNTSLIGTNGNSCERLVPMKEYVDKAHSDVEGRILTYVITGHNFWPPTDLYAGTMTYPLICLNTTNFPATCA